MVTDRHLPKRLKFSHSSQPKECLEYRDAIEISTGEHPIGLLPDLFRIKIQGYLQPQSWPVPDMPGHSIIFFPELRTES